VLVVEQITAERDYARGEAVMSSSDDEDSSDEEGRKAHTLLRTIQVFKLPQWVLSRVL